MADKKKKKEETESEEEDSESEEGSEESEEESEEEEESSEDEKPKKAAPAEKGKKKGDSKKTVSSSSHVSEGVAKTEVKKTYFGSSDTLTFSCSVPSAAVSAGSQLDVRVEIKNDSPKTVKSIEAWLRVYKGKPKGKGKKVKRPKPKKMESTEQEYFQGARFPLQGYVSYEGVIAYPLPKKT